MALLGPSWSSCASSRGPESSLRARPSMAITSNSVATSSAYLTGCSAAISHESGGSIAAYAAYAGTSSLARLVITSAVRSEPRRLGVDR